MKRLLLTLIVSLLLLSGCGTNPHEHIHTDDADMMNELMGNETDEELSDDALTVLLCGPTTNDIETIISEYERLYNTKVNLIKYSKDIDWTKFSTKIMSQDSDFDLFMPVPAHVADIVRNGAYEDPDGEEFLKVLQHVNNNI